MLYDHGTELPEGYKGYMRKERWHAGGMTG